MSFAFYTNAGLTVPLSGNIVFEEPTDHSSFAPNVPIYLGDPSTGDPVYLKATSDPGVDQITISITDSAAGSGQEASNIKLATTEAGLATATAGAPLDLGVQIQSGVANAAVIWIQFRDSNGIQGTSTELGLETNQLGEY